MREEDDVEHFNYREYIRLKSRIIALIGIGIIVFSWVTAVLFFALLDNPLKTDHIFAIGMPIIALVLAIPYGFLFVLGYYIGRRTKVWNLRWCIAIGLPFIAGFALIYAPLMNHIFPARVYEQITNQKLPKGARVTSWSRNYELFYDYMEIEISADSAILESILRDVDWESLQGDESYVDKSIDVDWSAETAKLYYTSGID